MSNHIIIQATLSDQLEIGQLFYVNEVWGQRP